jgi:nitrite reductase (NADH) small subunit
VKETILGPLSAIPPGEGREFSVDGVDIAVFHLRDGGVRATQARCPHREGPLADGITGGNTVVCPFHAWKFDLSTGKPILGECAIRVFPVRADPNGILHLTLLSESEECATS